MFCKELWDLMLSAQESPVGVPRELLEAKKLELQKEQVRTQSLTTIGISNFAYRCPKLRPSNVFARVKSRPT